MKIAVIGSRSIIDEEIVKKIMFPEFAYQNNILITGGAPGVDSIALKVAETNEIEYEIIRPVEKESLPEWNYKLLYIFRNIEIDCVQTGDFIIRALHDKIDYVITIPSEFAKEKNLSGYVNH